MASEQKLAVAESIRKPGRPRRFNDRRLEVLRAAAHTFSELGFRQATLEDVAKALGITRPALYHYAKSKDALLAECGIIARHKLSEAFAKALLERDGASQIRAFFGQYSLFVCEEFGRCFALIGLNEMAPAERKIVRHAIISIGQSVEDMIRLGIEDGTIRECDPVEVSRAIFASFNGLARWWDRRRDRPLEQVAETILDAFFLGITPRKS